MIYPNNSIIAFCEWLINVSWQKLTGPQLALVNVILLAAQNGTGVTTQQWTNFNQFTAWRYPFYTVYAQFANAAIGNLLASCIYSCSFQGNANDDTGTRNGTAVNVLYDIAYGKIGQGVRFNGTTSAITIPVLNLTGSYTISVFAYLETTPNANNIFFAPSGSSSGLGVNTASLLPRYILSVTATSSQPILPATWYHFCVVSNAGSTVLFVNGVQVTGPHQNVGTLGVTNIGGNAAATRMQGFMDLLCVFNRALTLAEIQQLYNGGNGLAYPF